MIQHILRQLGVTWKRLWNGHVLTVFIWTNVTKRVHWIRNYPQPWGYRCEQAKPDPYSHRDIYSEGLGRGGKQSKIDKEISWIQWEGGVVKKIKQLCSRRSEWKEGKLSQRKWFWWRPEWQEGVSHAKTWGKNILERRNSDCKIAQVRT